VQLFLIAAGGVVEFDQFTALGQGKTDALAPQDQLQADLVPRRINAFLATSFRAQQALLFIEALETKGAGAKLMAG
jgi:hypothetical protein